MTNANSIQKNYSLRSLNWWKVGGEAEFFSAPTSVEELIAVWTEAQNKKWLLNILSGGSNILIQEGKIRGLVLSLHELRGIELSEISGKDTSATLKVIALSGTPKGEVSRVFLQHKLSPAIFLTGIPGDIGGGVVMNAGVGEMIKPREFCEIVEWVEILRPTGELERVDGKKIKWEYRHSTGWQPGVIVRVAMTWPYTPDKAVLDGVRTATRKRISTQPLELPSGGSTFRNPDGHKAAKLIDECGLKGFRIGGASVSTKHANFLVNDKNATADEIHQLICHVQATVAAKTGIQLQNEVIYLGEWDLNKK